MSKLQTIICLLIFLTILFSMDMIFGNPIKETFKGKMNSPSVSDLEYGSKINYKPVIRQNTLNGNMTYPNSGFLATKAPASYIIQSDDQPLHFSFPF